ncbi:MAG: hypothetical protein KUA43_21390 [Hoeflea sp.]|uniref:hypothetical protein n=1 Tax=Hoeflea sp. TaxID=1940281 RepID=UPI001DB2BDCF|nr:hypothetical protein [Hoeflea sp.]MBU4527500.1 hypothetical protein [Alphaproteobacteria bacterium]MBU4543944.1 hypothetical protein [Alphaproteobacteria bacterium]MBU4552364.1 hypothetical protein [Alphaproteobacteria bacterium]MBV1726003.1 hypothetical protein [Hoeflea sp.]MBV1782361.1 hypothetical protein [Hoeflea sp.]
MSARLIFDTAPLGAIIRYSDGTPRPPERHRRKLQAWERHNNTGRLVKRQAGARVGKTIVPGSFTLHEGDYGTKAVIVLKVFKTFSLDSDLDFTVIERPSAGSVLVLSRPGDAGELVHVAVSRAAADEWLSRHGYPDAVLYEVTADQLAADHVEGRAV